MEKQRGRDRMISGALWLGGTSALAGLAVYAARPDWRWTVSLLEALALFLLGTVFIVRYEAVRAFSGRRSTRLGVNSLLMSILLAAILIILNFLSYRHSGRIDFSETGAFTLSPQTLKVLDGLQRDVKVTAFTQSQSATERSIVDLLDGYAHRSHRLTYHLIDPDKNPAVAKNYGITTYDTLVLESGKQETQVKEATEQELTNAIIRVSRDERRRVLFLKEHGEHRLDDTERNGYSNAGEALTKQGYDVAELSLLTESGIPDGTSVLVIGGPQKPFLPQEKTAIAEYLDRGGKVLALLDPQVDINLDDFLLEWGVRLGPGLIVDTMSRLFGGDFTIPIVNNYPDHAVTRGFNIATFFPLVQSITYDSADPELRFEPLAQTTPNSWSKTDLAGPEIRIDPDKDIRGPFTVAGMITRTARSAEPGASPSTGAPSPEPATLVVYGDSDFVSNAAFYFSGNGDLFLSTVNFLAKESDLIAITPKENRFSPLFLSREQGRILMYVSLIVIPGIISLTGFRVWRRRRRL